MPSRNRRPKISTTIAPENRAFLESLIKGGAVANLSEAVDRSISVARRAENRRRLDEATAAFYDSLSGKALRDEQRLELAIARGSSRVDFDGE